jgi:hypothetical protein
MVVGAMVDTWVTVGKSIEVGEGDGVAGCLFVFVGVGVKASLEGSGDDAFGA